MKSVLISIQPKWCELIANGKKTIEVIKTKPKLETPFKVYIYCTKGELLTRSNNNGKIYVAYSRKYQKLLERNGNITLSGKVIGEFVCDGIISHCEMANADIAEQQGCIKREKIFEYSNGKELFGWHISNLVIYDKPRELSEFKIFKKSICPANMNGICLEREQNDVISCENLNCSHKKLTKPPQSWCYVEGVDNNAERNER